MLAQTLEWRSAGELSYLILLYGWNLSTTTLDLALGLGRTRRLRACHHAAANLLEPH